ncbi:hypothetical protein [Hymenobacter metallicola]|uniref:Bacteriophage tail tape measure N-terminal domain-containing protein n=1 Tax=Hymenobacter metallicola TaxID=2563114 RepID=A0A4Z0QB38_9BACT|nr:hypothetical protein [Hymenobacter metallicola]TGE26894.1 hypothetical protein E5K02_10835 [Hymenobacter metallicola]
MAENSEERKIKILLDAVQPNASIKEMTAGASLMNNQLAKMSADDPGRAKLQDDFARLTARINEARVAQRTILKTTEELAEEQRQLQATTEKVNQENREVILNGQRVSATFTEMKSAGQLLEKQLHDLAQDDPGRAKLLQDYHALQDRIGAVKQELNGMKKGLGDATESGGFLKQTMASALGVFTGIGLAEVAQTVGGFLKDSREEFQASARITADLQATLESTKMVAGLTADEITRIGEARAKVTLFDDDETNRASSLLLTFTNIKKGVFEEAVPAIQDLAQKMAGDGPADLKGASIQVGKALNDPVKGITALTRVGVTFTEQQKEQITAMVKAGDTAGAQKLILAELNKEFGGSAEAARKAAGGMATLSMRWGEFKEQVGEKVSAALDVASQWLGRFLDKAEPIVEVFSDLYDEAAKYVGTLWDIAESLGLVSEKGDSAGFVVKLLTFLFTLLLAPVKAGYVALNALANGFIDLYNTSEVFRGGVGGLVEVFKQVALSAWNFLGGVGDLLVGIFTLDTNKIKAGLRATFYGVADLTYKSGINAAENFAKGYADSKDKRIVRKASATTNESEGMGGGTTAAPDGAPAGPSQKELEKAAKERKKLQDAADKARLEDIKQWVKEEGDLMSGRNALLTQLGEQAMNDEMQRRELQRQKLFDDATKKVEQLTGLELDHTEQVIAIVAERDLALRELSAKYAAEEEQRRVAGIEQKRVLLEAEKQEKLAELELKLADGTLSQELYEAAIFAVKQSAAERDLALLKEKAGVETAEYKKANAEKLRDQADFASKKKGIDAGLAKEEAALNKLRKVLASEEVNMLVEFFGKKSAIGKLAMAAQKALAISEIQISLTKQMMANGETGAKISAYAPPVTVPLGAAYTIGANILAGGVAAASISKVLGFRSGGRTSAGGGSPLDMAGLQIAPNGELLDQDGFAVAGLVHKNEYVIPEWMRSDPKVVQVEQWLETRRLQGRNTGFVEGGRTSDDGSVVDPVEELPGSGDVVGLLQQLVDGQRRQDERINTWASELRVVQDTIGLSKELDVVKEVQQNNGITG